MSIDAKVHSEQSQQEKATKKYRKLSRRWFLGAAAAASTSMALGMNRLGDLLADASAEQSPLQPTPSPVPTEAPLPSGPEIISYQELTLYLDETGVPIGYKLPDEDAYYFDENSKIAIRDARSIAMSEDGEPEVIITIEKENVPLLDYPTPERPYIGEMPDDVLTPSELAEYRLDVINSDNEPTASQLFIRKGALEGILEPLDLLKKHLSEGEHLRELEVVVLNTEFLDTEGMSYYGQFAFPNMETKLRILYEDFQAYKDREIAKIQADIDAIRTQIQDSANQSSYHELNRQLFDKKIALSLFERRDVYEVFTHYLAKHDRSQGVYYFPEDEEYFTQHAMPHYIFLAAPELAKHAEVDTYGIGFDKSGQLLINRKYQFNERRVPGPRIDQSYPDPSTFTALSESHGYAYRPDSIGFIVYHEFAHYILVSIFPELAKKGILKDSALFQSMLADDEVKSAMEELGIDTSGETFDSLLHEAFTDRVAKLLLRLAYQEYSQTGSDKKYSFVFKIPPDLYQPGGYQITELQKLLPLQQDMAA